MMDEIKCASIYNNHEFLNKIIYDVGKLQRAHPTLRGHFASAYLVGSNMLRAYIFFIYGLNPLRNHY